MEGFKTFLETNYIWFLVISIVLVLALIGYLSEERKKKHAKERENDPKYKKLEQPIVKTQEEETKEQLQKMENVSLGDVLKDKKLEDKSKKGKKDEKKEDEIPELKEILDEPLITEEESKNGFEEKK